MEIRKISIGVDYKVAMHYLVGQDVLNGGYKIHAIRSLPGSGYEVYIENEHNEVLLWKLINLTMPCVIEYNINF
jgi:hypothetical protein